MAGPKCDQAEIRSGMGAEASDLDDVSSARRRFRPRSRCWRSGWGLEHRFRGHTRRRRREILSRSGASAPTSWRMSGGSHFWQAIHGPHTRHPMKILAMAHPGCTGER